ncbi:peptide chain release factor 1 [candidate division KSB1 bacterium]|nr:peptide chain release factor 1 [candidate division KSB1 bacterium]NIR69389.1 peptide chain release factor 1 [candidate division KSB1 bacterium]NIS22739.1 peptide chain release factor 1 [candidate division KSB1 bacterium]NIT69585.1 peptide chain release factor 1 [candidate division KSB1 bacterium]NIU23247.1 peptide chain release factor 1 [candidate division KSB1 bacterium]
MFEQLQKIEQRHQELSELMMDPEIAQDPDSFKEIAKEKSSLDKTIETYQEYKQVVSTIEEDETVLKQEIDEELRELAEQEIEEMQKKRDELEDELKLLLLPKDPNDSKNAIVEIRAGTGGEEAGIFAGDLFRMYSRFAERRGWKIELLSSNPQGVGGFKEIIFMIKGAESYGIMKYESGVHRVQRVPKTEGSGRIHTSAASVVVLPEADEVEIDFDPNELKIDVFRSSGPGGQSVNTTDSAVRITHQPTGMVVTCQDEKSQHKNKAKALKVLQARLLEKKQREEQAKLAESRRSMVSTGDRSAKIRTYNFPQGRLTDHRIGLTLYRLDETLDGDLDEVIEQLRLADQAEQLKKAS